MRFSIFLPLQFPRPWNDQLQTRRLQEAIEQAELADILGFHCVWTQEHHFLEEYSHGAAPEVLLGAISQRTSQIRLGHGVMLMPPAYNHPVRAAERIAMLDHLSGGRVEWGTGASGTPTELEAFGISDKHAQWGEGVREAVRLLTEEPYSGVSSAYLEIPERNLVPKSVQKPHPPMWMACANRGSVRYAAQNQIGALTFAFINAEEAQFWVQEYYKIFNEDGVPLGAVGNPNIAMLSNFFCHEDRDTAIKLGLEGAEFFAWGLRHYFQTDNHRPGKTNLWESFQRERERPFVNLNCFNTPEGLTAHFHALEEAGVDEIILLQQAGNYRHEDICKSLELFAATVMPEFKVREGAKVNGQTARPDECQSAEAPLSVTEGASTAPIFVDDLLHHQAIHRPKQIAFDQIDEESPPLSYETLSSLVTGLSHKIASRIPQGGRVAIVGESGVEFIVGVLATIRSGGIAIPTPGTREDWKSDRLISIVRAASPELVIGSDEALSSALPIIKDAKIEVNTLVIDLGDISVAAPTSSLHAPTEVAMIQYTSGSTSEPKGVPITQNMLATSLVNIENAFALTASDRFLTFLPLHHTLALIVHVMASIRCGGTCFTMKPAGFVQDHLNWLYAISENRITVSAAPMFAYARLSNVSADVGTEFDLSTWRLAICGGEPVHAGIARRFTDRWRCQGLSPTALTASYGLTEGTATVTGDAASGLDVIHIPEDAAREMVSTGPAVSGLEIFIADPDSGEKLPDGDVGEICLHGATIAQSYLDNANEEAFVTIETSSGPKVFLRTGDVGALYDGRLVVTGRISETIIVRGENFYPYDIEGIVSEAVPGSVLGGVAAVALPDAEDGTEALGILIEMTSGEDVSAHHLAAQEALMTRLGVRASKIEIVQPGSLPRAPNGKLLRREAETLFMTQDAAEAPDPEPLNESVPLTARKNLITLELSAIFSEALKLPPTFDVEGTRSFFAYGGDSLLAAQTLDKINERFGVKLSLADHVGDFSVEALAKHIENVAAETPAMQESNILAEYSDFRIEVLTDNHATAAADCLAEAFERLPMVQAVDGSREDLEPFMTFIVHAAAKESLSLVALDQATDEVVAVGICDQYLALDFEDLSTVPEKLTCLLAVQLELDERYLAVAGDPGQILHMNLIGLRRSQEGRELPQRMIGATLDLARARGFNGAVVHAASPVIQRLMQDSFGFVKVAELRLRDYEYQGLFPFAKCDEGAVIKLLQTNFASLKTA